MKRIYETPEIEVVEFDTEDVITVSSQSGETPFVETPEN